MTACHMHAYVCSAARAHALTLMCIALLMYVYVCIHALYRKCVAYGHVLVARAILYLYSSI